MGPSDTMASLLVDTPFGVPVGSVYRCKAGDYKELRKIGKKFRWVRITNVSRQMKKEARKMRKEQIKRELLLELCNLETSASFSNARANVHNDPNIL